MTVFDLGYKILLNKRDHMRSTSLLVLTSNPVSVTLSWFNRSLRVKEQQLDNL